MFPTLIPITPEMRLAAARMRENRAVYNDGAATQHHYYERGQVEADGLLGEFALHAFLGLDWHAVTDRARDGGADAVVSGIRIDVKATRHRDGGLILLREKRAERYADLYVLAVVHAHAANLVSWARRAELLCTPPRWLKYTAEYYLPQNQLRAMAELRPALKIARSYETLNHL